MVEQKIANHFLKDAREMITWANGWQDSQGNGNNTIEVGTLPLYYKYCQYNNTDVSWATTNTSMGAFFSKPGAKAKEFENSFLRLSLSRTGYWILDQSAYAAYADFYGKPASYKYNASANQAWIDNPLIGGLGDNRRIVGNEWMSAGFGNNGGSFAYSGTDDYSHDAGFMGMGGPENSYYNKKRFYRGDGYDPAINGAISDLPSLPSFWAGGGHCFGGMMPGADGGSVKANNPAYWDFLNTYTRDDGTSYRRIDLFQRVPIIYHFGGKLRGFQRSFLFGFGNLNNLQEGLSPNDMWNMQTIVGAQEMEIGDRIAPIGGAMISDSPNDDDVAQKKDFITGDFFADYLAAIQDSLGIASCAIPLAEPTIPKEIPRIYMV